MMEFDAIADLSHADDELVRLTIATAGCQSHCEYVLLLDEAKELRAVLDEAIESFSEPTE